MAIIACLKRDPGERGQGVAALRLDRPAAGHGIGKLGLGFGERQPGKLGDRRGGGVALDRQAVKGKRPRVHQPDSSRRQTRPVRSVPDW